jgi:hypothetical protein
MAGPNIPYAVAPKFPLEIENGRFIVYGIEDLTKVVDQNVKMVLLTVPGERLFDLQFGVGLARYLFLNELEIESGVIDQNDSSKNIPPLRNNIIAQMNKYLPYITIDELDLDIRENSMSIRFRYFVNDSSATAIFKYVIQGYDNPDYEQDRTNI